MPVYHYIPQRSEEWDRLHIGVITASNAEKVVTPKAASPQKATWQAHAQKLIAERILKRQVDFAIANSKWMERGEQLEEEAFADYEILENVETKPIGFVASDDGFFGCSPDRLVGDDGLLELKCPAPQTQVKYLLSREVEDDYRPQLQFQLWVTQRKWVDIYSYHPELPRCIIRVYPEATYQHVLQEYAKRMKEYIVDNIILIAERMKEVRREPDAIEALIGGKP
jgi:hypothetical protein